MYEALDYFKCVQQIAENKLNAKIKVLRIDRGREYLSNRFQE